MDPVLRFLVVGYVLTVAIELPILWVGLAPRHSTAVRVFAGFWLTAATYPIVVCVLPVFFNTRLPYLLVAETFAPLAECALFLAAFPVGAAMREGGATPARVEGQASAKSQPARPADAQGVPPSTWRRDCAVIVAANLASFGLGEVMHAFRLLG